mgnify:CR=1 FL=1
MIVVSVLWAWGAWQRRWIADDGLIVLRTVRNLLAGNGPVFNAGERVESNTSTLWTYLVYLGGIVGGPLRRSTEARTEAIEVLAQSPQQRPRGPGRHTRSVPKSSKKYKSESLDQADSI